MDPEQEFETKRLDHLGIVAGICREIGLIEQIDRAVGPGERNVTCGEAVQAMVLNALGFTSRALYLMPDFLRNKPVDVLIRPDLLASDFNDDTLGRSLEDLYERGVTEVFAGVASQALAVFGIEHRFVHLDSSSFHLHGEYATAEPEPEGTEPRPVTITHGYSRDHRPDLKQVVVQLITSHRSALPVWLEVLSGNSSDKESFTPAVAAYCAQLEGAEQPCFVMDSAGYAEDNLKSLGETHWLMRVPETLKEAKRLVQETEQESMTTLAEGYWGREFRSDYAGVAQRWLVVFSQAAYARELKTLERKQARELAAAEKGWRKLSRQDFNCEADADQAVEQFNRRWQYHQVAAQIIPQRQYLRRGRPAAEEQPEVVGYQLSGEVQVAPAGVALARRSLGKFILTTNQPDAERLPAAEMLANYTAQGVSVERGFRFLKDPLFFAHSLFLKKPERIMALVMIMGLALLIFALAEHRLRAALRENDETLPDQKGKPTSNPTLRWVFQIFEGLDVLSVSVSGRQVLRQVLNLKPVHHQVLQLLGPQVKRCYLLAA